MTLFCILVHSLHNATRYTLPAQTGGNSVHQYRRKDLTVTSHVTLTMECVSVIIKCYMFAVLQVNVYVICFVLILIIKCHDNYSYTAGCKGF
jgi:hypothetical protein